MLKQMICILLRLLMILVIVSGGCVSNHKTIGFEQQKQELDETRAWFWTHPPIAINQPDRRQRMDVIQRACDALPSRIQWKYVAAWKKDQAVAEQLEQKYLALYYLRAATQHAFQDIRNTRVKHGVALWYIYNLGYVLKTPDACFAIDLHAREAETLVDILDFLLVTHRHIDHSSKPLLEAMLKAGKPVITNWYPGSTIVKKPTEFTFGKIRVQVDVGDHRVYLPISRWGSNNVLMFQIDCGAASQHCTIYHSGDGSRIKKMTPDRPVDIFLVHIHQLFMSVEKAVAQVRPRVTFVSHVLELSHPKSFMRRPYAEAFQRINRIKEFDAFVLTWGERWLLPGTIIAEEPVTQNEL